MQGSGKEVKGSIKQSEGFVDHNQILEDKKKALMDNFKDESFQEPPPDDGEEDQPGDKSQKQESFRGSIGNSVMPSPGEGDDPEVEGSQAPNEADGISEKTPDPKEVYEAALEQYRKDKDKYDLAK